METLFTREDVRLVDLSVGIEDGVASEPDPPRIEYDDHADGAAYLANALEAFGHDVAPEDFPAGMGLAWERLELITHAGTHVDAPWHYGPESGGEPARTIDEVPLEWCTGEAVILDFTWKEPRSEIGADEVAAALDDLNHDLSPGELVFVETGADDLWGTPEYLTEFPGLSGDAVEYLIERGIRVIGTDAYGLDKPFAEMGRRFAESGDDADLWPAHLAGRDREYCQIEKLANLNELPRRTGVSVTAFPVKVDGASGAWCRPVAFVEAEETPATDGGTDRDGAASGGEAA